MNKLEQILERYDYWRPDPETVYRGKLGVSPCGHCGGTCHGDGTCGGDGD